jgi:uncharacterized protein
MRISAPMHPKMSIFNATIKPRFICAALVVFLIVCTLPGCGQRERAGIKTSAPRSHAEPRFTKKGELTFFSKTKKEIITIDIEIPDSPEEIMRGLMHRTKMLDTQGMLFILTTARAKFFWMKDTYIPLDMIFVDEQLNILHVEKNTTPLSEDLIPVPAETKYTIEVIAGFAEKYGISTGNSISFKKL